MTDSTIAIVGIGGTVLGFLAPKIIQLFRKKAGGAALPPAPEKPDVTVIDNQEKEALTEELARLREELASIREKHEKLKADHEALKAREIAALADDPAELEKALKEYQDDKVSPTAELVSPSIPDPSEKG